jgi:hypothetical protein
MKRHASSPAEAERVREGDPKPGDLVTDGELVAEVLRVEYAGPCGVVPHIYVDWRIPG